MTCTTTTGTPTKSKPVDTAAQESVPDQTSPVVVVNLTGEVPMGDASTVGAAPASTIDLLSPSPRANPSQGPSPEVEPETSPAPSARAGESTMEEGELSEPAGDSVPAAKPQRGKEDTAAIRLLLKKATQSACGSSTPSRKRNHDDDGEGGGGGGGGGSGGSARGSRASKSRPAERSRSSRHTAKERQGSQQQGRERDSGGHKRSHERGTSRHRVRASPHREWGHTRLLDALADGRRTGR